MGIKVKPVADSFTQQNGPGRHDTRTPQRTTQDTLPEKRRRLRRATLGASREQNEDVPCEGEATHQPRKQPGEKACKKNRLRETIRLTQRKAKHQESCGNSSRWAGLRRRKDNLDNVKDETETKTRKKNDASANEKMKTRRRWRERK